jgi:hypothetical protein
MSFEGGQVDHATCYAVACIRLLVRAVGQELDACLIDLWDMSITLQSSAAFPTLKNARRVLLRGADPMMGEDLYWDGSRRAGITRS